MSQATMTPLDLRDHLHVSILVAEGIFMAIHGLADTGERDALATLVAHLQKRLQAIFTSNDTPLGECRLNPIERKRVAGTVQGLKFQGMSWSS